MSEVIKVNNIPSRTFGWLKVNHAEISGVSISGEAVPEVSTKNASYEDGRYIINENVKDALIKFSFEQGSEQSEKETVIVGRANSKTIVVMDYRAKKDADGLLKASAKISLEKGADLTIVQVERTENVTLIDDILAELSEDAVLNVIRIAISGRKIYEDCRVILNGRESRMNTYIGYYLTGDDLLDMNYEIDHYGKRSECAVKVTGVLKDRAYKCFRGTIDLKKGCTGSVGNETEDVLILDDECTNKTVPVILCGEDDVVGNHGATIGRMDEDLVFYLQSRGLGTDEIYRMVSKARIDSVIGMIPDGKLREELGGITEKM